MRSTVLLLGTLISILLCLYPSSSDGHALNHHHSTPNYTADWPSLDSRPNPDWYDKSKFGVMLHWGVYSVPTFGNEWFWNAVHQGNAPYVEYMTKNFKPGFTYQEFARDFTAENFDPKGWTELFKASGAKYVILTTKHHDGYTLWPSKYSFSWNAMDVGPHRDLVGELGAALKQDSDLIYGLYHSMFEWFNPMYLEDAANQYATQEFVDKKVIPELKELVNKYEPHYVWSDGDWMAPDVYWRSTAFLAWLFNESAVRDSVVVNDRWGIGTRNVHGGVWTGQDHWNPGVLQAHKWENAMSVDEKSWGYRPEATLDDYRNMSELIYQLVSTVSCGGNLLLNVGPSKDGRISPILEDRLRAMGAWLAVNGAAIYESRPWLHQKDSKNENVW